MTGPVLRMQAQSWLDTYPNAAAGISEEWVRARTASWFRPESIARRLDWLHDSLALTDTNIWRVALHKGEVAGMLYGGKDTSGQELHMLYVDKKYHGRGAAQQLMDVFLAWASPGTPITLAVTSYNARAIRFYEKYGFKKIPGSEHYFDEIIPVITMKRPAKETL